MAHRDAVADAPWLIDPVSVEVGGVSGLLTDAVTWVPLDSPPTVRIFPTVPAGQSAVWTVTLAVVLPEKLMTSVPPGWAGTSTV